MSIRFRVIDLNTGREPDLEQIALKEDWAESLTWCSMDGFAIDQDGGLLLLDKCGNYVFAPLGRFKVEFIEEPKHD